MLKIRQEQMLAFEDDARLRFVARLEQYLEATLPPEHPSRQRGQLEREIREGMQQGLRYGFTREVDVARFVQIVCRWRHGFFGPPIPKEALRLLLEYGTEPVRKLDQFETWAQSTFAGEITSDG